MDRLVRTRLTTAVVLVVVFASGVLMGMAAGGYLDAAPAVEVAATVEEVATPRRRPMYERVGPDEAQKLVIDSIVKEYRTAMKGLHAEFRAAYNPRYQSLVDETRTAIKGVLTPEQGAAYDSLIVKSERRRAERDSSDDRE